jgi:hypothetical protein
VDHHKKKRTGGERYFMLVIDYFSILTWVVFLREKCDAFEKFKKFKVLAENQTGRKLKAILLRQGRRIYVKRFQRIL